MSERHKSGPLKQQNKAHKHGKHRSRVSVKALTKRARRDMRKAERRNQVKQIRSNKRHEAFMAKRNVGVEGTPPHLVVVIPMSAAIDCAALHAHLCGADDTIPSFSLLTTLSHHPLRQRFTFIFPPFTNLYGLLDVAKVADTLLLVYQAGVEVGQWEQLCLDCCYSQGLPATFHTIQGLEKLSRKEQSSAKKAVQKAVEVRFPGERVHTLDSQQDAQNVLRQIASQKRRVVACRDVHPHLVAECVQFQQERQDGDQAVGTLKVSGYVRGRPLSVNSLVHIPGQGDYQMAQITAPADPHPLKSHSRAGEMETDMAEGGMEEDVKTLAVADAAKQESLQSEVELDPMEGEQTWPTEEDFAEAAIPPPRPTVAKRVPKGTSEYQAAWIVEDSDSDGESSGEGEGDDVEVPVPVSGDSEEGESEEEMSVVGSEMDTDTVTYGDTDKYDAELDLEAEERQLQLMRAERENAMFPDEVDTPQDVPARVRFQKYRGLKSFRSSPWDPKENLPRDYARIFQFESFARTKKRVLSQESEDCALPGWYVTVHIKNVPRLYAETVDLSSAPLVVFGLLQHENKMSVVHFILKRTGSFTLPVKSKERLVFHCGVRRFSAAPIFSQHTVGDKQKYERFFPREGVCVASVFALISYPPQPVLVFKPMQDTHHLLANGSLYSVNPNRVICKRIVISGHPFKIHKKSAVIRYMFFNREDIQWFKPVELRTKYGRRGHIKEPLGTHGHMKCTFDGQLKAQDTVLMNLYKRVYPKWTYSQALPLPSHWGDGRDLATEDLAMN